MTYTKDDFRQMFQKPFNIDEWQQILQHYFHATELRAEPERTKESTDDEQGYYLGAIDTADSYRIGLFYYKIQHGNIARKRVGLRNLVKSFVNPLLGDFNAALVVFDSGTLWRLSLICDMKGESTAPKRFTYVFGESDNYYNTPVGRFKALQDKGISYANLRDAFSVEQVNKTFFAEYKAQYEKFCQYLCEDPEMQQSFQQFSENSGKAIRDYVKKMLGRIVFLYFVQRKGWLNGDLLYMSRLFSQSADDVKADFLDRVLEPMFFGLLNTPQEERHANAQANGWDLSLIPGWTNIPYLNGGLFEQDSIDKCKSVFPCDYFKGLFDFFDSYNFTVDENDPNDAEVGIDPEMLGVIFENLLEDNKDKGAFYTPKEIVRYMCQESLIAYLNTNTDIPQEQLRQFVISPEDKAEDFSVDSKAKLLSALQTVKICDPAIGSGAFPMGLLNELLHCREALGESADHAQIKKSIIQNNIYGVDIEKGAVDIARLRFWLSLVVDEDVPQPLPNLDYKIMQGNSLLESFMGYDLSRILPVNKNGKTSKFATKTASDNDRQGRIVFGDEQDTIAEIQRLIRLYFSPQNHKQKETLKRNIDTKVKEYIIICGGNTPSIVEAVEKIDDNNKPFFLWHLLFADVFQEGGFDIVIGNPPFGAKYDKQTKRMFQESYITAKTISGVQKASYDTFTLFIERGYNLLKKNGNFAYIVPIALTSSDSLTGIHRMLINNCHTIYISSYAVRPKPVFENAVVNTSILLFQKTETPCQYLYSTKMHRRGGEFNLQNLIDNLQFVDVKDFILYGRIPKIGTRLEQIVLSKILDQSPLHAFLDTKGKPIYYRTSGGRYFKVVTNYPTTSTKEKAMFFKSELTNAIGCILSSSLAFWFYQIYSNNLDWKTYEIENFTIPQLSKENIEFLDKLYTRYLTDIESNANVREVSKSSSYKVNNFKEYKIVRSKSIIDEIDDYICPLYGLTKEETDFIKNYELEFRLAGE